MRALEEAAVQRVDRACPGCGYNLRGLPKGRRCPECGVVPPAEFRYELEYADARWVRWLGWGMVGLFLGSLCYPIALVGSLFYARAFWLLEFWAAGSLLLAAGVVLLTSRDPAAARERPLSLRRALRGLAVLTLGMELAMLLLELAPRGLEVLAVQRWLAWGLVFLVAIRILMLGYFLQTIAERIPNEELGYRIVATAFVFASSFILTFVLGWFDGCLMVAPAMVMLGSYVWGLGLLWCFVADVWSCVLEARSRKANRGAAEGDG